jgi:hypothetical protein
MKLYVYNINLELLAVIDDVNRFESGILNDLYIQKGYIISSSEFDIVEVD